MTNPTWLDIEKVILEESKWLKNNIFPYKENRNILNYPDDALYRLIAILIVAGEIKVSEYNYLNDKNLFSYSVLDKKHGSNWHDGLINYLANYFQEHGYNINKNEPPLYYGHADLEIRKESSIYFEIDSVNIFKLYINLFLMDNVKIIIITANKIIKFEI